MRARGTPDSTKRTTPTTTIPWLRSDRHSYLYRAPAACASLLCEICRRLKLLRYHSTFSLFESVYIGGLGCKKGKKMKIKHEVLC